MNLDNPNVEVALWGRNLTNKEYYQQQFDIYAALGIAENFQGDPRTFGVTFTYRFKQCTPWLQLHSLPSWPSSAEYRRMRAGLSSNASTVR